MTTPLPIEHDLFHLVYGSALFLLAVFAAPHFRQQGAPSRPWRWLQWFGVLHGSYVWVDLIARQTGSLPALQWTSYVLMAASFVCLTEFGRSGLRATGCRWLCHPALHVPLLALAALGAAHGFDGLSATTRHSYGFIGGLWAAAGIFRLCRAETAHRWVRWAGSAAAALYAVVAGLVTLHSPFLEGTWLDEARIQEATGVVAAIPGTILALLVTASLWHSVVRSYRARTTGAELFAVPIHVRSFLLAIALALVAARWSAGHLHEQALSRIRSDLVERAGAVASVLDPALLRRLAGDASDSETTAYKILRRQLTRIQRSSEGVRWVYLYGFREGGFFYYVMSDPGPGESFVGPGDLYVGDLEPADYRFMVSGAPYAVGPYSDHQGRWFSASSCVFRDPATGFVKIAIGLDLAADDVERHLAGVRLVPMSGFAVLIVALCIAFQSRRRLWETALQLADVEAETRRLNTALESRMVDRTRQLESTESRLQRETRDREQASVAARDSARKYQSLTEQLPAIVYTVTLYDQPRTTYISPQVYTILGFTTEEWLSDPDLWRRQTHPEDLDKLQRAVARCNQAGEPMDIKYRMRARDGSIRWVHNTGQYVRNDIGNLVELHGVMLDITEHRWAEELINAERTILESVAKGSPLQDVLVEVCLMVEGLCPGMLASVLLLDKEGSRLLKGAAPHLPASYSDAIHGAPIGPAAGSCGTAAYRKERVIVEDILVDPLWNGYRDVAAAHGLRACWSCPIKSREGTVLGTLALYYKDVRKPTPREINLIDRAAALAGIAIARERIDEALRESIDQYRLLFDHAPIGVFHYGADLLLTDCNARFCELFRSERRNIVGRDVVNIADPSIRPALQAAIEGREGFFEGLCKGNPSNGGIWMILRTAPMAFTEGSVRTAVGIVEDISERMKLEEERIKTQKLDSLGVLAGGIAHDFNNILTAILGNLSLARDILPNVHHPDLSALVEEAERASRRASNLTQQLLTFAKGGEPVKRVVNLTEAVRESALFAVRGSSSMCHLDLANDLWPADVDAAQISQVIHNLVLNADQAMSSGGHIYVQLRNARVGPELDLPLPEGPYVELTVRDTGVGIAAENLSRIFDPYFTTKERGTGLGLTTSYSIVRRHGGCIHVDSKLGEGTTFHVFLPAAPARSPEPESQETPVRDGGRERVLVMDDEHPILDIAGTILESGGYSVSIAPDAETALRLFEEAFQSGRRFKAVVLDLTIPGGMGGREVLARIRRRDATIKAIVCSGYSTDQVLAHPLDYGFDAAVPKPYTAAALLGTVTQVIAKARA